MKQYSLKQVEELDILSFVKDIITRLYEHKPVMGHSHTIGEFKLDGQLTHVKFKVFSDGSRSAEIEIHGQLYSIALDKEDMDKSLSDVLNDPVVIYLAGEVRRFIATGMATNFYIHNLTSKVHEHIDREDFEGLCGSIFDGLYVGLSENGYRVTLYTDDDQPVYRQDVLNVYKQVPPGYYKKFLKNNVGDAIVTGLANGIIPGIDWTAPLFESDKGSR